MCGGCLRTSKDKCSGENEAGNECRECQGGEALQFQGTVNKGLIEKVAFEQRPEVGGDTHPYMVIREGRALGTSWCKTLGTEACLVYSGKKAGILIFLLLLPLLLLPLLPLLLKLPA